MKPAMKITAIVFALSNQIFSEAQVAPVKSFNQEAYSGRWFQMFTTERALESYELSGECITTDVHVNEVEGTLSLLNTQTVNSTNVPFFRVMGTIYPTSMPGKFNVVFKPSSWVEHVIVALGPLDASGHYTYSIGTNPKGNRDLIVLARDPANWDETACLALIQQYNLPTPVHISQGENCSYSKFANLTHEE
jgi:lipocalin